MRKHSLLDIVEKAKEEGIRTPRLPSVIRLMKDGKNIAQVAKACELSDRTVRKIFRLFPEFVQLCECGQPVTHSGWCAARLERKGKDRLALQRRMVASHRRRVRERGESDTRAFLSALDAMLPKELPVHIRQELRQELAIKLLMQEAIDMNAERTKAFINAGDMVSPHTISLDTPIEETDKVLLDTIETPERFEVEPDDSFDFETHCYKCGERGQLRRLHGHTQCMNCGEVTEPCCDI